MQPARPKQQIKEKMDDCPTCGSHRRLTQNLVGLEQRRFPCGKLECGSENLAWHQQLENLQRALVLSPSANQKATLQAEIENLILEFCAFDFRGQLVES